MKFYEIWSFYRKLFSSLRRSIKLIFFHEAVIRGSDFRRKFEVTFEEIWYINFKTKRFVM